MSTFRYRLFQIFILISFVAILVRLLQFQVLEHGKHLNEVRNNHNRQIAETLRGDIVDRFGNVLALDISKYTVEYNPLDTEENKQQLAYNLARIINRNNLSAEKLNTLVHSNFSKILARELTKDQAAQIRKLNSRLLLLRRTTQRYYPQKTSAAHLLGYVDLYGKARQGIEASFEKQLLKNTKNKLSLSIDSRLQAMVEHALYERIAQTHASRGTVIVMRVDTGEIYSWASYPAFDPNRYYEAPLENTKNWALTDVYQPGSIFKMVTVSSALDSGTVNPDYTFYDRGYIEVERWKIANHGFNPSTFHCEQLDLEKLFARSSNTFAGHLALKMGANTFYNYIRSFGFGNKTEVELMGETKGIVKKPHTWHLSDTATTGMGQGAISITPFQMLAAANAIANNGVWIKPTLIRVDNPALIHKKQAELIEKFYKEKNHKTIFKRQGKHKENMFVVIKPETSKIVRGLLTRSLAYNIKEKYSIGGKVEGLEVAGKTGTAQKIKEGGGYHRNHTVASFLGFFPASEPRFIVLSVIDDPQTDGGWGDTVSGPVFNKVAGYCKNLYLQ